MTDKEYAERRLEDELMELSLRLYELSQYNKSLSDYQVVVLEQMSVDLGYMVEAVGK